MKKINFIPFAKPFIDQAEINDVVSVLKSGWLTSGPKVREFEELFAEYVGAKHAIAVNSATSGLHLSLEALGIKSGDEIITTIHTFTATAEVIRYFDAKPVFVDIEPRTFNIDLSKIEAKITKKTKAIIPVHFAGYAVDMQKLNSIAKKHKLYVIEDAAHCIPTTSNGKKIGSPLSDASVFSFYANKNLTTGEGGMICVKNNKIADRIKKMRLHGIDRDVFNRFRSTKPSWMYDVIAPGYKYNLTDLAAAIGIQQLKKIDIMYLKRKEIVDFYNTNLQNLPIILPQLPGDDIHSFHLYIILLSKKANISRDDFINEMFLKGVGCSVHYIPLHRLSYWQKTYNLNPSDFPVSEQVYCDCISLPLYPGLNKRELNHIVKSLKEILSV